MRNSAHRAALVAAAALFPHTLASQAASTSDSAARATRIALSGYVEASYAASSTRDTMVGRLFDRHANQFTLNALKIGAELPAPSDRFGTGARIDVLFGQNATLVQSNGLSLGPSGDITQLYLAATVPVTSRRPIRIRAGKLASLMGLEVIESVANPNFSEGNQFNFAENFTATGVEASYQLAPRLEAQVQLVNGWDVVVDNNAAKTVFARVTFSGPGRGGVAVLGYTGAEQSAGTARRAGGQILAHQQVGGITVWAQGDVGREEANSTLPDSSAAARWSGAGLWIDARLSRKVRVAVRGDYFDDEKGARTSSAFGLTGAPTHRITSGTVTASVGEGKFLLRSELRWDRSNLRPFDGRAEQTSVALAVVRFH